MHSLKLNKMHTMYPPPHSRNLCQFLVNKKSSSSVALTMCQALFEALYIYNLMGPHNNLRMVSLSSSHQRDEKPQ